MTVVWYGIPGISRTRWVGCRFTNWRSLVSLPSRKLVIASVCWGFRALEIPSFGNPWSMAPLYLSVPASNTSIVTLARGNPKKCDDRDCEYFVETIPNHVRSTILNHVCVLCVCTHRLKDLLWIFIFSWFLTNQTAPSNSGSNSHCSCTNFRT